MARVTFVLNELLLQDQFLGAQVEKEIRTALARMEPVDLGVECRITLQDGGLSPATRIGIKLSAPGAAGHPGWAQAFGLPIGGAVGWLREGSLPRALGLVEPSPAFSD